MIKYFRVQEEPYDNYHPYENCVGRNYRGNLQIFRNDKWQHFNIHERGLEDGYPTESITEAEAEKIVGEKLHTGEEKFIKEIDTAINEYNEKYGHLTLDEMIELAKEGNLK